MDFILQILALLKNEATTIEQLKSRYVEFSNSYPLIAALLTVPFVFAIGYIFLSQIHELINKLRSWTTSWKGILAISASLIVAFSISYLIVNALQAKPVIRPEPIVFGQSFLLRWDYDKSNRSGPLQYEIQSSSDRDFLRDILPEESHALSNLVRVHRIIGNEAERYADGPRYWRVRAVVPQKDTHSSGSTSFDVVSPWSDPIEINQYNSVYDRIVKTGKVKVFVSSAIDQGHFIFQRQGQFTGFEIELIERVIKELSRKLEREIAPDPVPVPWQQILEAPAKGEADMIIAGITKSNDRESKHGLKFTRSYYASQQALLYKSDIKLTRIGDVLKGKRIGVMSMTTGRQLATILNQAGGESYFEIVEYPQIVEAIDALLDKPARVDFVIIDRAAAIGSEITRRSNNGKSAISYLTFEEHDFPKMVPPYLRKEEFAIGIRADEPDLIKLIDSILKDLEETGTIQKLLDQSKDEFGKGHGVQSTKNEAVLRWP
nr:ABC transporter substrate-binding protein [Nitrosomonas nitrosa]